MSRRSSAIGLAPRIAGLAVFVAVVVVLVSALVAFPLIRSATIAQSRDTLSNLADLTAAALDRGTTPAVIEDSGDGDDAAQPGRRGRGILPRALADVLVAEQVSGFLVRPGSQLPPDVTDAEIARVAQGQPLSLEREGVGEEGVLLIEGRRLNNGAVVILEQPVTVAGGIVGDIIRQFAVALAAGVIIAIIVGVVIARRITRPLQEAQDAANAMAAGHRDVRLEPSGIPEVADIALALNALSEALEASEGRQREFLLAVSHELRTPLTGIQGYGEAMADGVIESSDVPRTGTTIAAEAKRLNRLVTDLLDLGRAGAVDFRIEPLELDLVDLARQAEQVWGSRCAREQVAFSVVVPDEPVIAVADPTRVRQIIDNLAENALRVSPAGSQIVLAVAQTPQGPSLQVRDSGPGLSAEDMAVAFEPGTLYERYRGVRPVGTGLGLALVGRLATRMGGAASVATAPEGGAAFTIRLPAALPQPA